MSDRGHAAQVSFDWAPLLNAQAAFEAFRELPPNLNVRDFEAIAAERGEGAAERSARLIQRAKSEEPADSGPRADEPMRSATFERSGTGRARRVRRPHRAADLYPGKRRRRLCRVGR